MTLGYEFYVGIKAICYYFSQNPESNLNTTLKINLSEN